MADRSLRFVLSATDRNASRTLSDVANQGNQAADRIGGSFKKMGGLIAAGFAAAGIGSFVHDAFSEAAEAQKVGAQTTAVLNSTGGAAGVTATQIGNLSTAISKKAGIDDEAIQSGENLLLTFTNIRNEAGKGNDIFNQSTQIMTDMSVALGQDMKSSAIQLGKALNDPIKGITALQRVGVSFTQQQKDQIATLVQSGNTLGAQKIILKELTREFGGSAAAQATDADKMKVAFGNLEEQVGTALMPVVSDLANFLTNDVIPAFSATVNWIRENRKWLVPLAATVGGLWAAWKGYTIISAAATAIKTARAAFLGLELAEDAAKTGAARFGSAMGSLNSSGGRAGLAVAAVSAAVIAAGVAITKWNDKDSAMIDLLGMSAEKTGAWRDALQQSNGALDDNIRLMIGKQLQDSGLASKAAAAGISLRQLTTGVTGNSKAMNDLIAAWQASGDPSDETMIRLSLLHTQFSAASSSAKQLNAATKDNTKANKDAGGALDKTKDSMKSQTSAADDLSAALDKLSGNNIDAAQAELRFKDGVGEATAQVKQNGAALTDNTAKGRANREWLLNQISSINDVATAQQKAGVQIDKVTARMGTNEDALRRAAVAAGFNRGEVDKLIKKYAAVPAKVATKLDMSGNATDQINAAVSGLGALAGKTFHTGLDIIIKQLPGGGSVKYMAGGSDFFPGGLTHIAEREPEIVDLPRGTKITPQSRMSSSRAGGAASTVHLTVNVHAAGPVAASREMGEQLGRHLEVYLGSGGRIRGIN